MKGSSNIKRYFSWFVFLFLSFFPALIWSFESVPGRFDGPMQWLGVLAQLFGLVGMAMFSSVLILSARFQFVERLFGGLDKLYKVHHTLGGFALILLLFHPLFSALRLAQSSFSAALSFLFPGDNNALNFGIFSLWTMILLLGITFYAHLKYKTWKFTHKFLGAAFLFAVIHVWLIPSDVSNNMFLRYYILGLAFVAIAAYSYRVIFYKKLVKKYLYVVSDVKQLGNATIEISLEQKGNKKMLFAAGQFIFISFKDDSIGREPHPFSLVSSPYENTLKIGIKALGEFTAKLNALKVGTEAEIEGPFGGFSHVNCKYKDQIWIAGGIGVTPFLSMIKALKPDYIITLFYCVKNKEEAVYLDALSREAEKNKNLKIIPFFSDEKGFINADVILDFAGDLLRKDILMCAPPGMMKALEAQFLKHGVKKKNIHYEEFKLL